MFGLLLSYMRGLFVYCPILLVRFNEAGLFLWNLCPHPNSSEFVELTNYGLSLYSDILWLFACMVGILSDLIRNRSLLIGKLHLISDFSYIAGENSI